MKALCMLALAALALAAPLRAETLASVGSEKISRADFDAAVAVESANAKRELSADERAALLRSMVNQRLLVAEARRRKLDRDPAVKGAVAEFERRLLSERVYNEEVGAKAQVSAAQAREFYDQNPALFDVAELSQIVVLAQGDLAAAERRAQSLAERLKKAPKTFAATAKKESDDAQSKPRGGDLGALRRGMLLPELEAAAFAAKAGDVVGPVRTQFGWHILQVRKVQRLSWEVAGAGLQAELQQLRARQLQQALLDKVAKDVKVNVLKDRP